MAVEGFKLPEDNAAGTYHGRTNPCGKDNLSDAQDVFADTETTAGATAE